MLHKHRENNTGETGRAWRVECNNSKTHNHFLSIELYGDRYSRRDGLWRTPAGGQRGLSGLHSCGCVCVWCRGHQNFPVDIQMWTPTINKMGMTVIFAFMEGKNSNNVKSPFYRTVMALWDRKKQTVMSPKGWQKLDVKFNKKQH